MLEVEQFNRGNIVYHIPMCLKVDVLRNREVIYTQVEALKNKSKRMHKS